MPWPLCFQVLNRARSQCCGTMTYILLFAMISDVFLGAVYSTPRMQMLKLLSNCHIVTEKSKKLLRTHSEHTSRILTLIGYSYIVFVVRTFYAFLWPLLIKGSIRACNRLRFIVTRLMVYNLIVVVALGLRPSKRPPNQYYYYNLII